MPSRMGENSGQTDSLIEDKVKEPSHYVVLMHNDNYTHMDFVVEILCDVFHKDIKTAQRLMMQIHTQGLATCGIYTKEIAESKISRVHQAAKQASFPLRCTMEKE